MSICIRECKDLVHTQLLVCAGQLHIFRFKWHSYLAELQYRKCCHMASAYISADKFLITS